MSEPERWNDEATGIPNTAGPKADPHPTPQRGEAKDGNGEQKRSVRGERNVRAARAAPAGRR